MPALPPSVAGVPSAVPAFVGYTEKARRDADNDLILEPTKIHSLDEYEQSFGVAGSEQVSIAVERTPAADYRTTSLLVGGATPHDSLLPSYLLYYAVRMFFENGGGPCFIVSVGTYGAGAPTVELYGGTAASSAARDLRDGLDRLALEDEITLIVIPEAVKLDAPQYGGMVQAVLDQCGRLGDRFGIFDIVAAGGTLEADLVTARTAFGTDHLQFGAAYYPFVRTALTYGMDETTVAVSLEIDGDSESASAPVKLDNLRATDPSLYSFVKTALNEHHIIMPPSGAVAGAYAATDAAKGVWTAPANIALAGVIEPVVLVDDAQQEKLNIDPSTGKSINAIRYFPGKGSLVWGARTLAGNDPEWRYIPVRRFFNMVGESVGQSTRWAMSDPNDANTWLRVRSMIEDYLARLWRDGALVGTTPDEAYFVRCGLGATMTTDDVRQGRIIVEIGMAVVRPAEFTTLKISHEQPPT